jgi:hypothetical protein
MNVSMAMAPPTIESARSALSPEISSRSLCRIGVMSATMSRKRFSDSTYPCRR